MFRHEMEQATENAREFSNFPNVTGPVDSEREKLESIATSLGIEDRARLTDEELRTLISKRMSN